MNRKGFTLIELLVTIGLIAIITTIVVVNMTGLQQNQNEELYTAYKSRITTATCTYIDKLDNELLRDWCKNTSGGCKIYISTLVSEGLVDGEEVDPKTNIKLKDETTSAYVVVDWNQEDGYKEKSCTFYDDDNNKSVNELDLSNACKYEQTFVGTTLNATYGCDSTKAVYGCKTKMQTKSYTENAPDLVWTIEDNYHHSATCSHEINVTNKYYVKHYQMNPDGSYPDEPTETEEFLGYIGTSVTPSIKTYEGFVKPSLQAITITEKGDNTIIYKYERNIHHLITKVNNYPGNVSFDGDFRYGDNISLSINNIVDGYRLVNYSFNVANVNYDETNNYVTMPNSDLTITCNFEPIKYDINYDFDGGTDNNCIKQYTVETNSFTLCVPKRNNYGFLGWTGDGIDTETKNYVLVKGNTGNKNYKANWVELCTATSVNYTNIGCSNFHYQTYAYSSYDGSRCSAYDKVGSSCSITVQRGFGYAKSAATCSHYCSSRNSNLYDWWSSDGTCTCSRQCGDQGCINDFLSLGGYCNDQRSPHSCCENGVC